MVDEDEKAENTEEFEKTSIVASDTFKGRLKEADDSPPCFILLVGPARYIGKQWTIASTDMIIGRSPNCDIYVDDRSVSKSHTKITLEGKEVSIMDLESTNKTVVNGRQVPSLTPIKLTNNDQIKVGNVIFKFLEKGNIEAVTSREAYDRSQMDGLTKIFNKAALLEHSEEAFKRSSLMQFPLSAIVFDLDHFRNVNNTYGHLAGDYVLKELSDIVKARMIRDDDFFARFGGEEFVIMLHGSNIHQAYDIAERIRAMVEKHKFEYEGVTLPITISAGVAEKEPQMVEWDQLFEVADKALYESKHSGRNKVSKV